MFAFEEKAKVVWDDTYNVRNEWMEEVESCGTSRGAHVRVDRELKATN